MRTPLLFVGLFLAPLPLLAQRTTSHRDSTVRSLQAAQTTVMDSSAMVPCGPTTPSLVKRPHKRKRHHPSVTPKVTPPVTQSGVTPAKAVVHHKRRRKHTIVPKSQTVPLRLCPSVRTLAMNVLPSGPSSTLVPEWAKALATPPVEPPAPPAPIFTPSLTSPFVSGPALLTPSSTGHLGFVAIPGVFLLFLHNHGGGTTASAQPSPPPRGIPISPPLTPPATVPEPETWTLLGSGLVLLGVTVRRRFGKRD
jgi:hypothetical protein